jgi:hypothetical protein
MKWIFHVTKEYLKVQVTPFHWKRKKAKAKLENPEEAQKVSRIWKNQYLYRGGQKLEQYIPMYVGYGWLDLRAGRFIITRKPKRIFLDNPLLKTQKLGLESYRLAQGFYRKQRL